MNRQRIRIAHQRQANCFRALRRAVKAQRFVYRGRDQQGLRRAKLRFLDRLKHDLKRVFWFNDYQAEFVKNEAISRVLHRNRDPERLLVAPDPKRAEKLVHTSFVLGRHYFRFIMTMFK